MYVITMGFKFTCLKYIVLFLLAFFVIAYTLYTVNIDQDQKQ